MTTIRIECTDDVRLDVFRLNERQLFPRDQRRDPAERGLFIAEGDLVVERALAAGCKPIAFLCAEKFVDSISDQSAPIYVGDADLRREVTGLGVPLDALAVFERPENTPLDQLLESTKRVVAMECVDNPTNVGAVVRSAAALGWDTLALDWTSADPFARRALRVSMGTSFSIRSGRTLPDQSLIAALNDAGLVTVAFTPSSDAFDLRDLSQDTSFRQQRLAVLFGSERGGLSDESITGASIRVRIPMQREVDSLNVANAAAIALFALG